MRHLNEVQVARAVTLIQEGWTFRRVAVDLNVSQSVIHRLWNRYNETGQFTRRVGQGRGRITTPHDDRYLTISALRRRSATARQLQQDLRRATGVTVSDQTVRNRLREVSLRPRRPVRVPRLTRQHHAARLLFARTHVNWQLRQWTPVLFTDESRFPLTQCDGRRRVWRRRGEQFIPNVVQEVDRFGQGSVMVWGGISIDGRTDLVVVRGNLSAAVYIEEILLQHVLVAAHGVGPEFVLMHDNARPHVAGITRDVLRELDIQVMEWPAVSPDINPIEHVWDRLNRSVRGRPVPPQTLQDLENALIEEWDRIPQRDLRRLIRSMPRRCQAVINARGGHTPY